MLSPAVMLPLVFAGIALGSTGETRALWQRTDTSLAWTEGGKIVWQWSFDPAKGKPFFHPLSLHGGPSLTAFRPSDHPWHYGLWFSWKFINGANYWEEDATTGHAEGATRWSAPLIETREDGAATIVLELSYTHPSGRIDLTERRDLIISAPLADGSYTIDWRSTFVAGPAGAVLDRTPMPNEAQGKINGGYGGLAARLPSAPAVVSYVTSEGVVDEFISDRARPAAGAVAANVSEGAAVFGGLAILSARPNAGEHAPWYLVHGDMRFFCAAVLAPKILTLPPGGVLTVHYLVRLQPAKWTPASLRTALADWRLEPK
jgi:hypothetical protein